MSDGHDKGEGGNAPSPSYKTPRDRGWISLRQFAELREVTYHTVLRWIFEERVHFIQVGGQKRIYEDEIAYQIQHGTRPPNPEKLGKFGKENKRGQEGTSNEP